MIGLENLMRILSAPSTGDTPGAVENVTTPVARFTVYAVVVCHSPLAERISILSTLARLVASN